MEQWRKSWNPCLGSRSNFEVQAANSFKENYSNLKPLSGPNAESVFHLRDLRIVPTPFLFLFWKYYIWNILLEF